jgi:hypothetical protein|tara:strand:- start:827 stop:979 length:153 start_codon:yes stop_codon:yes gene_type:complete
MYNSVDSLHKASMKVAKQRLKEGKTAEIKASLQRAGILTPSGKLKKIKVG